MSLKVITGKLKKSNIKVPACAKPVKNIIKQSAFTIIEEYLKGAEILDLFAGSGALGIEALSRGASFCTFVENNYEAVETIQENLINLNLDEKAEVLHKDVLKFLGETSANYDIVFADPPYDLPIKHFLKTVHLAVKEEGIFILFHPKKLKEIEPTGFKFVKKRCFGKTCYSIFLREKQEQGK